MKRSFLHVSFFSGLAAVLRLFATYISGKLIAVFAGPGGIAFTGQFSSLVSVLQAVAGGGIGQGITRFIAEDQSQENRREVLASSWFMTLRFLAVALLGVLFVLPFASELLLFSSYPKWLLWLIAPAVILATAASWMLAVFNGMKSFRTVIYTQMLSALIVLPITALFVWKWKIQGAMLAYLCTISLPVFFAWFFSKKERYHLFPGKAFVQKNKTMALWHYTLMSACSLIAFPITQLIIRSRLQTTHSIMEAGIWESCNRISQMLLAVLTTAFSTWYLPRLSELKSDMAVSKEMKSVLKWVALFMSIIVLSIYVVRAWLISFLFSAQFHAATHWLPIQLFGDFMRMCSWVLAYQMIARSMTRTFLITEIGFTFVYIVLSFYWIPTLGAGGAVWAYAVMYTGYAMCMVWIFRRLLFSVRYA